MESKQNSWEEHKAIGNSAENIVEFLINSTPNWRCIKFGVENHIGELKTLLKKNNKNEISKRIRSMPDIVAVNTKTDEVLLIDVKYRSYVSKKRPGTLVFNFVYNQIKNYLTFWSDAHLVIVHNRNPYFFVINLKDVIEEKHLCGKAKRGGTYWEYWDFDKIQKGIRHILPNVSEDTIKKGIAMIPKK